MTKKKPMKKLITALLLAVSAASFAQKDVSATRLTHLLIVPNQATFDPLLTVQPGETLFLIEYNKRTEYFTVRYNFNQYYVYYPYLSDINGVYSNLKQSSEYVNYSSSPTPSNNSNSGNSSHHIITGPRGGKYYINKNGKKTYIKH
jgi:hypothetical protein